MTEPTKEELQREVEAQDMADRVWAIIMQRMNSQLEGVIGLEPRILHPHIDLWFAVRTHNDPSKVTNNPLMDVIADSLSGNWRMQQDFKAKLRNELQAITQRMQY